MECLNTVLPIVLYVLGAILLIVLIILGIKMLGTIKRVDAILDDVEQKSLKIDGVFDLVANTTDTLSAVSSKVFDFLIGFVTGLFNKKGNDRNE